MKCSCGADLLVDDEDFPRLSTYYWTCSNGSVYTHINVNGSKSAISMASSVIGLDEGELPDHKDLNIHNNQKSNLRIATRAQNNANSKLRKDNKSGFKGVHFHKRTQKWIRCIRIDGILSTKQFKTAEEAAHDYDKLARQVFGEFARLNFPEPNERGVK